MLFWYFYPFFCHCRCIRSHKAVCACGSRRGRSDFTCVWNVHYDNRFWYHLRKPFDRWTKKYYFPSSQNLAIAADTFGESTMEYASNAFICGKWNTSICDFYLCFIRYNHNKNPWGVSVSLKLPLPQFQMELPIWIYEIIVRYFHTSIKSILS